MYNVHCNIYYYYYPSIQCSNWSGPFRTKSNLPRPNQEELRGKTLLDRWGEAPVASNMGLGEASSGLDFRFGVRRITDPFSCSSLWPGHCRPLLLVPSCLLVPPRSIPHLTVHTDAGAHALLLRRCALSPANENLPSKIEKNQGSNFFQVSRLRVTPPLTFKGRLKF